MAGDGAEGPGRVPDQDDRDRIPLPVDEGPYFAAYAARMATLETTELEAELEARHVEAQAAADANDPDRSRRAAITLSVAKDELARRSPPTSDVMSTALRGRHENALAVILDDTEESAVPREDGSGAR